MYVVVNIGVDTVYMQCVCVGGDLTCYRYTLRGLVLQKSWGFSVKFMFVECRLILPKFRGFYVKPT